MSEKSHDLGQQLALHQGRYEREFCAATMVNHAEAVENCAWLEPGMFVDRALGKYWAKLLEYDDPLRAANEVGVADALLYDATSVVTYRFDEYARQIAEAHYLREIVRRLGSIAREAGQNDVAQVQKLVSQLSEITPRLAKSGKTVTQIDGEFRAMLSGGFPHVKTHTEIDAVLGGLFGTELSVLAARTSVGKSAFAMQIARSVAADKRKVLFLSLEMSRWQLWARMACPVAGYTWTDVRLGKVDAAGLAKIEQTSKQLEAKYRDYLIVEDEAYSIPEMHQIVVRERPELIIVDHLGEIAWHDPTESYVVWYGKALKFMRQYFSRTLGSHTMVVHQLSRKVDERVGNRPKLSDLRWSSDIEQMTDVVIFLHREDYFDDDPTQAKVVPVEAIIAKNRQGERTGGVIMDYNLPQQWFYPFNSGGGQSPMSP